MKIEFNEKEIIKYKQPHASRFIEVYKSSLNLIWK